MATGSQCYILHSGSFVKHLCDHRKSMLSKAMSELAQQCRSWAAVNAEMRRRVVQDAGPWWLQLWRRLPVSKEWLGTRAPQGVCNKLKMVGPGPKPRDPS